MSPKALLDEKQIRSTEARLAILDILKNAQKPLGSAEVISQLIKRKIDADRATVFRIINLFTREGILHKLEFREGKSRYELSSLPHHHHAVCMKCGTVKDIEACDIEEVEKKVRKQFSFTIQTHSLELFGLCIQCQI